MNTSRGKANQLLKEELPAKQGLLRPSLPTGSQRRPLEVQAHIPEPTFDFGKDNTDDGDDSAEGAGKAAGGDPI